MPKRLDIKEGTRYGRLVVIKEVEPRKVSRGHDRQFLCKCDCGNMVVTLLRSLRFGRTSSCGCKQRESATSIGGSKRICPNNDTARRIYSIWRGMKSRCYCKANSTYDNYGGKGISVCDEWRNEFLAFYRWSMEHGYKDGLTIDRIDGRGNYEPSNCRWATMKVQANNTKKNVLITHGGETHTVTEWSRITGINRTTLQLRMKNGWDDDMLFSKPMLGGKRIKGQCYGRKQQK
jgi:hypothetical protein